MLNKLHGVKFPQSKKAYVRVAEDTKSFYEGLLPLNVKPFQHSKLWPWFYETQKADIKVGDTVAYLYLFCY